MKMPGLGSADTTDNNILRYKTFCLFYIIEKWPRSNKITTQQYSFNTILLSLIFNYIFSKNNTIRFNKKYANFDHCRHSNKDY